MNQRAPVLPLAPPTSGTAPDASGPCGRSAASLEPREAAATTRRRAGALGRRSTPRSWKEDGLVAAASMEA